jgi:hypothetical protein
VLVDARRRRHDADRIAVLDHAPSAATPRPVAQR